MGRKHSTDDYQRTEEENGWVAAAHEEEDSIQQTKVEPSDRYRQNQAGGPGLMDNVGA